MRTKTYQSENEKFLCYIIKFRVKFLYLRNIYSLKYHKLFFKHTYPILGFCEM